uniref:Condensin complex subunit 1 C-terminal domain-containing protein n=1 Tax=Oryza brachyantha TaxID=4533 RepID=J3N8M1_ORYBR
MASVAKELALGCLQNLTSGDGDECQQLKVEAFQGGALGCVKDFLESCVGDEPGLAPAFGLLRNMASFRYIAEIAVSASFVDHVLAALDSDKAATRTEAAMALAELCNVGSKNRRDVGDAIPRLIWMLEAKAVTERDAAARALAALVAASGYRKLFKKEERGIVNVVQLLDPGAARGVDARFPVSVLLAVSQSRRCRKQMVAAGACGFLQGLLAAEVDGAKKLADCLGRGKMLGVFPRS